MLETDAAAHFSAVAALLSISFLSFMAGVAFRKWPEKIQAYAEELDGLVGQLPPEVHRAMVRSCGFAFTVLSAAALAAAAVI